MDTDSGHTLSFEQARDYLDGEAEKLPQAMFCGLNGGVVLQPRVVRSPHGAGLYTMGEYHCDPCGLGRYISIYYGSFVRVHGRSPLAEQRRALFEVLRHELTHHMESLAGVRDLEVKDEAFIERYKAGSYPKFR